MSVIGGPNIVTDGLVHYFNFTNPKSYRAANNNIIPSGVAAMTQNTSGYTSYFTSTREWPNYEKELMSCKVTTTVNQWTDGVIIGDQSYGKPSGIYSASCLVWCPATKVVRMGFRFYPQGEDGAAFVTGNDDWQYVKRENFAITGSGNMITIQVVEAQTGMSPFTFYVAQPMINSGSTVNPFIVGETNNTVAGGGGIIDISKYYSLNANLTNVSFDSSGVGMLRSGNGIIIPVNSGNLSSLTNSGNSFTLETWFMSLGDPFSQFEGYIFGRQGFHMGYRQRKGVGGLELGSFILWFTGNSTVTASQTIYPITLNRWYHLVGSIDSSGNFLKAYVDGILNGSGNITQPLRNYANAPFFIGQGNTTDYYGINGRVGLTRFYNRALSPEEVLQNYNAEKLFFGR